MSGTTLLETRGADPRGAVTPEQVPASPITTTGLPPKDPEPFELVHGRRVPLPTMSTYSKLIANKLMRILGPFAEQQGLGNVVMEMKFRLPLPEDADRNQIPDLAFVSYARWSADRPLDPKSDAWDVVPELAVEVVSPSDLADPLLSKMEEYFRAGVSRVWIVYPETRKIYRYSDPETIAVFGAEAIMTDDLFPELQIPIAKLFVPVQSSDRSSS